MLFREKKIGMSEVSFLREFTGISLLHFAIIRKGTFVGIDVLALGCICSLYFEIHL
jgi:hypothetical protein